MSEVDPETQQRILEEMREPDGPDRYRARLKRGLLQGAKRQFVQAELDRIDRDEQAAIAEKGLDESKRSADAAERSATAAEQANEIAERASARAWIALGIAALSVLIAFVALFA